MNLLRRQWQLLSQEMANNQRLRLGAGLILVLVLVYIALVFDDLNSNLALRQQSLQQTQTELQEIESQQVWESRRVAESRYKDRMLESLWRSDSDGLAIASIQESLTDIAEAAGFTKLEINMGTPQPAKSLKGIKVIRAKINAVYRSDQVLDFIYSIESHQPGLVFERLDTKKGRLFHSLDAIVVGYVVFPESR